MGKQLNTKPGWVKTVLERVDSPTGTDDEVALLRHFKGVPALRRLIEDPAILRSLNDVHTLMLDAKIADADARLVQFVFDACIGYSLAKSTFQLPPSKRAPRIKKLARQAHKLANDIGLNADSFFQSTDHLSYLIERRAHPGRVAPTMLMGLRGDRFKISPLPTLRETLHCFAAALEGQASLIKAQPRKNQTPISNYIDRLIKTSIDIFRNTKPALIANVASVVSGEDVKASTVGKRLHKLK